MPPRNTELLSIPGIELTGSIPSEIGLLAKISKFCALASLASLFPRANHSSPVPPETLHLHDNDLSGTIPTTLGNLPNAKQIILHFNQLTGVMPEEVCLLTDESLEALVVSCHGSSGPDCGCCVDCSSVKWHN